MNYNISSRGVIRGSSDSLRKLGEANDLLFDLDDTIAVYEHDFIKDALFKSVKDHVYAMPDDLAQTNAALLHGAMHDGDKQKGILDDIIEPTSIRSFWEGFTDYLHRDIQPENVHFDPRLVKLINFAVRNSIGVGVISNSTPAAGHRVLSILNDRTGIDLHARSSFLGSGPSRKPKADALRVYSEATDHTIEPDRAAYIGNAVSDILFAKNTNMVPVFVDYENTTDDIRQTDQGRQLIDDSVVINDFAALKNHIELLRPNYKRQISFSVDKSLTTGEKPIDRTSITSSPTEDNLYRMVHQATEEVMNHVPAIWQAFDTQFSGNENAFSVVDLPGYQHATNEANGAYILPDLDTISDPDVRNYYTNNRLRKEGSHTSNRGPSYYRQYIGQLSGDFAGQIDFTETEVEESLRVLENPTMHFDADHIAVLGVEDNLRGNILATYLSMINLLRDGLMGENANHIADMSSGMREAYRCAVELQYSHMLGLEYDRSDLTERIRNSLGLFAEYKSLDVANDVMPKFKTPEVDNPLAIAVRANYLCRQYPEASSLVGVASGGVELAEVARMLYEKVHGKEMKTVHYPISVHNGLTMWSKDKNTVGNQAVIDRMTSLENLAGQNVVVCEDNSNSGQTLERVVNRIKGYGASTVHFAVTEIDPTRIILHHVQQKAGEKHNIGQAAERVRPIANYFHPDFVGAVGVVKILPQDNSFSKIIAQDTANRYIIE